MPAPWPRRSCKQLDDSEADIQTALKLSPEQPELLNYLGYSWVDRGRNIPEALTMLEKARTLRPYDGYIVDSVGWAYYQLGRYDDAAKTLEAAVLLVPGDPTINDHLGDALWRAGRQHRCALPVEPCPDLQRQRHRQGGDRAQAEDRLDAKSPPK